MNPTHRIQEEIVEGDVVVPEDEVDRQSNVI